jgi:hypothetical protein
MKRFVFHDHPGHLWASLIQRWTTPPHWKRTSKEVQRTFGFRVHSLELPFMISMFITKCNAPKRSTSYMGMEHKEGQSIIQECVAPVYPPANYGQVQSIGGQPLTHWQRTLKEVQRTFGFRVHSLELPFMISMFITKCNAPMRTRFWISDLHTQCLLSHFCFRLSAYSFRMSPVN